MEKINSRKDPMNELQESDWGDIWNLNCKKHEIDKVAKGKRWLTDDDSMRNDFLSIMTLNNNKRNQEL